MIKINQTEFKTIDTDIEYLIKNLSFIENKLSDAAKNYLIDLLRIGIKLDQIFQFKDGKVVTAMPISMGEASFIVDTINLITNFFNSKINTSRICTLDEIEKKYAMLLAKNDLGPLSKALIESFVNSKKEFVSSFIASYDNKMVDGFLYSLNDTEINNLRNLLGFRKVPFIDFSNGFQVCEQYAYPLTSEEIIQDVLIDKTGEKRKMKTENTFGETFYSKIYIESSLILRQCDDIIEAFNTEIEDAYSNKPDEIGDERKRKIKILADVIRKLFDVTNDVVKNRETLSKIVSLDELKSFRDSLDCQDFWLRKVIDNVIRQFNSKILLLNSLASESSYQNVLSEMSIWQKLQLLKLREEASSPKYMIDNSLASLTDSAKAAIELSINHDSLEGMNMNGFRDLDEYYRTVYELRVRGNEISSFRDLLLYTTYAKQDEKTRK